MSNNAAVRRRRKARRRQRDEKLAEAVVAALTPKPKVTGRFSISDPNVQSWAKMYMGRHG